MQITAFVTFALVGLTTALPGRGKTRPDDPSINRTTEAAIVDKYVYYKGNGSPAAGWPKKTDWGTFAQLWEANHPLMQRSCEWNGWGANDSPEEIANVKAAIQAVAEAADVDARFVLAIVMQESKACVRVPVSDNGVRNPGLMQSHNGQGNCQGKNPCPKSEIRLMIEDGTLGTKDGDGLKQTLAKSADHIGNGKSPRAFYAAARMYNSGRVNWDDLNDGITSTNCYACDVANRLTGWTLAESKCKE